MCFFFHPCALWKALSGAYLKEVGLGLDSGAQVGVIYSQEAPGHTGQKSFDSLILARGREAEACVL